MTKQQAHAVDRRAVLVRGGAAAVGAIGVTAVGGALAGPAMAVPFAYTPVTPYRSYDSRAGDGPIGYDEAYDISVLTDVNGNTQLPGNAAAVTFNLTVTGTGTPGYLAVAPGDTEDFPPLSTINWVSSGLDLANGGTSGIAFSPFSGLPGVLSVFCRGFTTTSTNFIVDITGYYA